jgi:hypothetical protein
VQISAVNGGGESPKSTAVTVRAKPPASPSTPVVTYPTTTKATLTWGAVSGATSYKVYGCGGTAVTVSSGTTYDCTRPAVGAAAYTVSVTALNAGGESAASGTASVLPPLAAPGTPTVTYPNSTTATLSWARVTGALSYNVYGCGATISVPAPGGTPVTASCTRSTSGSLTVYVTAVNAGGESAPSGNATVLPGPPAAPTTLTATAGNNQILLNWDDMVGATSYAISGCGTTTSPTPASVSNATCVGVTNGSTYTVSVTATGPGGTSAASTVTITLPYRITRSTNNGLTVTWTGTPSPAIPNNYTFSSCVDAPNSPDITCTYNSGTGNLTMSTDKNSPLGAVTLTWTFTRNRRPDVTYVIPFFIS